MRAYIVMLCLVPVSSLSLADEPKNLLRSVTDASLWSFDQVGPAEGSMKAIEHEIHFTAKELDGTGWHIQAVQGNLSLDEGATYRVKFSVRSVDQRGYTVLANNDREPYHLVGFQEELFASRHFRDESFTFTAHSVIPGKSRILFMLGDEKRTLIIKDMTLTKE